MPKLSKHGKTRGSSRSAYRLVFRTAFMSPIKKNNSNVIVMMNGGLVP